MIFPGSPREQEDAHQRRNDESRLEYLRFKADWLLRNGIIDVRSGDLERAPAAKR